MSTKNQMNISIETSRGITTLVLDEHPEQPTSAPTAVKLLEVLAIHLLKEARIPEAIDVLEHLLELRPDDGRALFTLGFLIGLSTRRQEAPAILRRAVDAMPGNPFPLAVLGFGILPKQEVLEIHADLEKALASNPNCAAAMTTLAMCLIAMGKTLPRAEQLLRKALEIEPDEQLIWVNLGRALWVQGKLAEADQALLRAVGVNPDSDNAMTIVAMRGLLAMHRRTPPGSPSNN